MTFLLSTNHDLGTLLGDVLSYDEEGCLYLMFLEHIKHMNCSGCGRTIVKAECHKLFLSLSHPHLIWRVRNNKNDNFFIFIVKCLLRLWGKDKKNIWMPYLLWIIFLINLPFLGGMTGLFTNQQLNNANMSNKQNFFFLFLFLLYIFFIFFFLTVTNKCTC